MRVKTQIEALLFTSGKPLTEGLLAELVGVGPEEIRQGIKELQDDYQERSFDLYQVGGGWSLQTKPQYASLVTKLHQPVQKSGLSTAAMETLAIIAYRQPVTKGVIDHIRGVRSDSAINNLMDRGLIEERGRAELPGRPILYGTTQEFLVHMGLNSLTELPPLEYPAEDFD
ncbi:MAG: SMC-Scp complex subunit ScpB [Limnochordia bacterium]